MNDEFAQDARPQSAGGGSQSPKDTLEADVLEENKQKKHGETEQEEVLLSDVAVTAEFDYIDLDDDSDAVESETTKEAPQASDVDDKEPPARNGSSDGPITRALQDFDAHLDAPEEGDGDLASPGMSSSSLASKGMSSPKGGPSLVTDPNLAAPGAWGYDQPQVSGVFSRYEEETSDADADEFDLFDEDEGEKAPERTLQEIVNAHEKQLRRLEKRVVYQKEVIQVVSELLVEARVVSKHELKKRLRALRDKSS